MSPSQSDGLPGVGALGVADADEIAAGSDAGAADSDAALGSDAVIGSGAGWSSSASSSLSSWSSGVAASRGADQPFEGGRPLTIMSIQSHVAYGHAGNSAAVFPLQRSGVDVYEVLTVNFSNHTGYGSWRGLHVSASDVWNVVQGIDERGALAGVDALLTGYLGTADIGDVVRRTASLVAERSPAALYCCDPVLGDVGPGFYTEPGIPEFMRDRVTPLADVMTPNLFELQFLTGRTTRTLPDVVEAARELQAMGPSTVLVTSVRAEGMDADLPAGSPGGGRAMHMVAVDADAAWQVSTPDLDQFFTGSGDVTAAMFLTHLLRTGSAKVAMERTAGIVYSLLERTHALGRSELALVAAQDVFVNPPHRFTATRIA